MMKNTYKIKLIQQGNIQSITLPEELNLATTEVTIRQEGEKLIIEPSKDFSLLQTLATLEDIEEDFPDVDERLLPLNNIDL
ncbi:MAG: antitoxin [Crocosphaera sp.]